jgi:hemoglobin
MKWTPIRPVTAFALILSLATPGLAGDGSLSPREIDSRIDQGIYRTIGIGAPIFNQGDQAGCYRLYQGTLLAIEPMLGHRAELRQEVAKGLQAVELLPTYAQRAMDLRKILDRVLNAVRSSPIPVAVAVAAPAPASAPAPTPLPPLWTRLGGEPAVRAVVHDFVALAAGDPQVDFSRGGRYPLDEAGAAHLEALLVQLISAVAGGPLKYEGRAMKTVHRGMAISDAQFDALAGDLVVVLKKYNVPKKEADELLAIIASTRKDVVEAESRPGGR